VIELPIGKFMSRVLQRISKFDKKYCLQCPSKFAGDLTSLWDGHSFVHGVPKAYMSGKGGGEG
jgi:hypothetical protein